MEQIKKNIWVIIVVVVLVVAGIWYVFRRRENKPVPAQEFTPQVEIQNNPIEKKVPEINPVEKANPFKYQNPLLK